jgi:hypothetical protein
MNGDGMADVFLGAPDFTFEDRKSSGALFVLFGRKRWPKQLEVSSAADVAIAGSRTGEGLSGPCATGDFDGDGLTDLAVFASESTLWNLLNGPGKVYLFFGRKNWPRRLDAASQIDLRMDGLRPNNSAVSLLLADLNGDGRDEFILGSAENQKAPEPPGEVRVWVGSAGRRGVFRTEEAEVILIGGWPGAGLGHALAAADLDGDGMEDLLISQPGHGEVYLLFGRKEWRKKGKPEDFSAVLLHQGERSAGATRLAVGDLDGDGLIEVAFTSSEAGTGARFRAGLAWVTTPYLLARVDVRPDMVPNTFLAGRGVSAVRLYGFSRSPQEQIEPASLRLAGAPAFRIVAQDYNGDGVLDWQAYFDNAGLRLSPAARRISLTARTRSGLPVGGSDNVVVVQDSAPAKAGKPGAFPR